MTTYGSANNGICTAGLSVASYGWNQLALATWDGLKPLAKALGANGSAVTSYDKAPLIRGAMRLTLDGATLLSRDFSSTPTYWTYADVAKACRAQVAYGEAGAFALSITGLTFSYVKGRLSDGTSTSLSGVSVDVADTFVFRQREDTGSYGSENGKYLFWPWQDER